MELETIEAAVTQHTETVTKSVEKIDERLDKQAKDIGWMQKTVKGLEHMGRYPATPAAPSDITRLSFTPEDRQELKNLLTRDSDVGTTYDGPTGGFLLPQAVRRQVEGLILKQSPMRQVCDTIPIDTPGIRIPIQISEPTSGWVGENEARAATKLAKLGAFSPGGGTMYARPSATEESIEDILEVLESFISESVIDVLASKESRAFVAGNGVGQPNGFTTTYDHSLSDDDSRADEEVQYFATGSNLDLGQPSTLMKALSDMVFSLRAGYRAAPGCAWLMSTGALAWIAHLQDTQGRLLFTPSLREGVPGTLLGYPVYEFEHMPEISQGNIPIAFGNWRRAYVIADRTGLSVKKDDLSDPGFVHWYFRKRIYAGPKNPRAYKLLKVEA